MSAVINALNQGYKPEDILKFLIKAFPKMASSVSRATQQGYQAKQILGFLSKNFDTEDRTGMSESERIAANRRADSERAKYGLSLAATAVALPVAGSLARTALQRALPQSVQNLAPGLLGQSSSGQSNVPQPNATSSGTTPQMPQGQTPVASSQTPPVNTNVTPTIPQPTPIKQEEIVNKIKELASIGKSPEEIEQLFKQKSPEEISRIEKETGKKFGDIVKESLIDPTEQARRKALETFKGKERERVDEAYPEFAGEQKAPKIEKASVVATPEGVGEVLEIRNGKALIDVDGKKHQVDEDELIQSPLPEKDLADLWDDLVVGVEKATEKPVSKNVELAGYDPDANALLYRPHTGAFYVYDELDPSIVDELTKHLTLRKTSGKNFMGAWEANTASPIGAAMSALIRRLQSERGGKGNEYKFKFETIYDALEPAKLASKERFQDQEKKRKEKEKEAKKREIDEKRRKKKA